MGFFVEQALRELSRNSVKRSIPPSVKEPSFVMIDGRRMAYDEISSPHPKGSALLLPGADAE